jgi:hypothetical protein
MIVHLIRSEEYPAENFWQVVDLLKKFPGPLQFRTREQPIVLNDSEIHSEKFDSEKFEKQKNPPVMFSMVSRCSAAPPPDKITWMTWDSIFSICEDYRLDYDLGDDEFVVLLTELSNEFNWFSAANPSGSRDLFVHTKFWDYFTGSDQRYPVAYLAATGILKRLLFDDYADLQGHWHEVPRGCMLDFCRQKKEISFKMRTGDVCPDCLKLIQQRNLNHDLVAQIFEIMEGIRAQMIFKERFIINRNPPELKIVGRTRKLIFPELGDLQISLNPLERTVYLFFLAHPEGIELSCARDYRNEFESIYLYLTNSDNREIIKSRIDDLVNHPLSNSLSEKISRIKRRFIEALGEPMAQYFIISGDNATPKKILIDRSKVIYADK